MSVYTLALSHILGAYSESSVIIDDTGHWFEMGRIHAHRHSTKMVKLKARRNIPDAALIGKYVSTAPTKSSVAFPIICASPQPACKGFIYS